MRGILLYNSVKVSLVVNGTPLSVWFEASDEMVWKPSLKGKQVQCYHNHQWGGREGVGGGWLGGGRGW